MMTQRNRLRGLQMGEAGHDAGGMFGGAGDERHLQHAQRRVGLKASLAHPQLEVGRDLIVAAARRMEPSRDRPDQLGQPAFGGHVDIFKVPVFGNAARFIFTRNPVQPGSNRACILGRDDALCPQHRNMSL